MALIKVGGGEHAEVLERVDYTAYGLARHHWGADITGDGAVTSSDFTSVSQHWGQWGEADLDRDGSVEVDDQLLVTNGWGAAIGAGQISKPGSTGIDNIFGYGGMVFNAEIAYLNSTGTYLARHRWYEPQFGRWLSRDPAGYVDGMLLYAYVSGNPLLMIDPLGLFRSSPCEQTPWGAFWSSIYDNTIGGMVDMVADEANLAYSIATDDYMGAMETNIGQRMSQAAAESDGSLVGAAANYGATMAKDMATGTVNSVVETAKGVAAGDIDAIGAGLRTAGGLGLGGAGLLSKAGTMSSVANAAKTDRD